MMLKAKNREARQLVKAITRQMNMASLAFVDKLRKICSKSADASSQTEGSIHDLINSLAQEVEVVNRRRFVAEQMLYRGNYPKVDAVLKALGHEC